MTAITPRRLVGATAIGTSMLAGGFALAASHSDAPLIKQDPQANITDVYTFIGTKYDDPDTNVLNVVVNVRPFSEPGDGPHYDRFATDALYSIHITDPVSGAEVIRYDFAFSAVDGSYKNPNTILSYGLGTEAGPISSIGDARQNYTQTYSVTRTENQTPVTLGAGLLSGLPNAGRNVTPLYNDAQGRAVSGAATFSELDAYTMQAILDLANDDTAFAGPREDSFYADVPGIFDLLDARILANDGNGVDGFKGYNVLTYGLQIPVDDLPSFPYLQFGQQSGVGVYATVSRNEVRVLGPDGEYDSFGPWRQVNRMGNPLFNEAFVPLADKDRYNYTAPTDDLQFATYAENPELARLVNFVFETEFQETGRGDLFSIYIPDVIRVDTTTGPVPLSGEEGFNRLSFLGGDFTNNVPSGWPNGRRFGDDVVDIALTALASGPTYETITEVGDNVNANDIAYNKVFPYAATPHSGVLNRKDPAGLLGDINGDGVRDMMDLLIILWNWD